MFYRFVLLRVVRKDRRHLSSAMAVLSITLTLVSRVLTARLIRTGSVQLPTRRLCGPPPGHRSILMLSTRALSMATRIRIGFYRARIVGLAMSWDVGSVAMPLLEVIMAWATVFTADAPQLNSSMSMAKAASIVKMTCPIRYYLKPLMRNRFLGRFVVSVVCCIDLA